jgi:hypothetical protein
VRENGGSALPQRRLEQKVAKFAKKENELHFAVHAKGVASFALAPLPAGIFCSIINSA